MKGREIVLCVTGGIAAYKAADLASKLRQRGANVTVAMTEAAMKLVLPITFEAVSGNQVATTLWPPPGTRPLDHISLSQRARIVVVAPATANFIGKVAAGIADDVVTTTVMASFPSVPVLIAPAMNDRMWANPVLQRNVKTLAELGYKIVGPGEGWLACGTTGKGRMAEVDEIIQAIEAALE
jgi:phosphopantothenoylcysteine decarboxylase/phosphopantothenate--cysteine ligase